MLLGWRTIQGGAPHRVAERIRAEGLHYHSLWIHLLNDARHREGDECIAVRQTLHVTEYGTAPPTVAKDLHRGLGAIGIQLVPDRRRIAGHAIVEDQQGSVLEQVVPVVDLPGATRNEVAHGITATELPNQRARARQLHVEVRGTGADRVAAAGRVVQEGVREAAVPRDSGDA